MGCIGNQIKERVKKEEGATTAGVVGPGGVMPGGEASGGEAQKGNFHSNLVKQIGNQSTTISNPIVQGSQLFPPGPKFTRVLQLLKLAPQSQLNLERLNIQRIQNHPKQLQITNDEILYANIGLIKDETQTKYCGTGMLIDKKFVLSCADNFFTSFPRLDDNQQLVNSARVGKPRDLTQMRIQFHSGSSSKPKITRKIINMEVHEQYQNHLTGRMNDLEIRKQYNFALVELDEEIIVEKQIDIKANVDAKNIAIYGFPAFYGDGQLNQKDGEQKIYGEEGQEYQIKSKDQGDAREIQKSNTIYYTTGTSYGMSGAPLLVRDQQTKQYKCVGVHVSFNNGLEIQLNEGIYFDTTVMKMILELKHKIRGPSEVEEFHEAKTISDSDQLSHQFDLDHTKIDTTKLSGIKNVKSQLKANVENIHVTQLQLNDHPLKDHPLNDHSLNDHPMNDHPMNDHPMNDHPLNNHQLNQKKLPELVLQNQLAMKRSELKDPIKELEMVELFSKNISKQKVNNTPIESKIYHSNIEENCGKCKFLCWPSEYQ